MDQETLKLRRLFAQYLLAPDSRLHVVRAMDGFQAQFLSNAMHAMRLRSADPDAGYAADGLVKSWTLRGTMHLFAEADLPLFLHDGCRYHSMEKGLSFLEFNYMIMQSYDFYHLFQEYGCNMQFGGDDQWSNMLGGTELIRRKLGKDAYAMTITLLMNSEGKKMGKTASGAVWLDPNKTSPYEFYQYWRNVGDADVLKCIRMLTFLPLEEIDKMDSWEGAQLNTAKEILAYELTKLVHGEEEANKAQETARGLFSKGGDTANMPSTALVSSDLADSVIGILDLMLKCGLVPSKGEARRLVQQGGVEVNGEKIKEVSSVITADQLAGEGLVIKKGKKVFHRAYLEG